MEEDRKVTAGAVTMSKSEAADTVALAPRAVALRAGGGVKSVTVKLEGALYAALRTYRYQREHARGTKLTDQQVIVEALEAFLPTVSPSAD